MSKYYFFKRHPENDMPSELMNYKKKLLEKKIKVIGKKMLNGTGNTRSRKPNRLPWFY